MEEVEIFLKAKFKEMYEIAVEDFNEYKLIPKGMETDISRTNKKVAKSLVFIFAGLYNKNKEQYDKGIADFLEYSTEQLDNQAPYMLTHKDKITGKDIIDKCFSNDEAVRQLGDDIKVEYQQYQMMGKLVFG